MHNGVFKTSMTISSMRVIPPATHPSVGLLCGTPAEPPAAKAQHADAWGHPPRACIVESESRGPQKLWRRSNDPCIDPLEGADKVGGRPRDDQGSRTRDMQRMRTLRWMALHLASQVYTSAFTRHLQTCIVASTCCSGRTASIHDGPSSTADSTWDRYWARA